MHKLDRKCVEPPDCLQNYDHHSQNWGDLAGACRSQIRQALVGMQRNPELSDLDDEYGVLCAYCEGGIYAQGHIEHFRRKNPKHFPSLTFEWTNLFLACGSHEHCGHYKDRSKAAVYNPDELIKPDVQNPEEYLYFHSSGEVRPRAGLQPEQQHMATETIRVFGLNNARLRSSRYKALSVYRDNIIENLEEISTWDVKDRNEYLQEEIQATQWQPYATTIKHFLMKPYP